MRLPCLLQGLRSLTSTPSASAAVGQGRSQQLGPQAVSSQHCLCSLWLSCGSGELGAGCDTVRVLILFCESSQRGESRARVQIDHGSCAADVERPGELRGGG